MRRPAAGGDAVTRWRRGVCYHDWVGSASASSAQTTSEACRRSQASANLFVAAFLRQASVLTILYHFYDAGSSKPRNPTKDYNMQQEKEQWKFAEENLEPKAAVKMLSVSRPREVVDMKEYCINIPALDTFPVPGSIPQSVGDGSTKIDKISRMAEPAQDLSRAALVFVDKLFKSGHCLRRIKDNTLKVDTTDVTILLSTEGYDEDLIATTSVEDLDNTISCIGEKLKEYIFAQNGRNTDAAAEIDAFFSLMAEPGCNKMWYAILNNTALVPLENLREYYVRTFEQLFVVKGNNHLYFDKILGEIDFPFKWHDKVSRNLNGILFILYGGAVYDATAATMREQADQITRLYRNSSVHVLDKTGLFIGRSDVCLIHYSIAPLLYSSLAKALQRKGWLASSNVHTLLVYTFRRR